MYKDYLCMHKAELFLSSDNFKEIFHLIDIPKQSKTKYDIWVHVAIIFTAGIPQPGWLPPNVSIIP